MTWAIAHPADCEARVDRCAPVGRGPTAKNKAIWEQADSPTLRKIWPLVGSQIHIALTVDQAVRHNPEGDASMHRRLVRVIEDGDEATIAAEVEEHIRHSVDEVLRRLT